MEFRFSLHSGGEVFISELGNLDDVIAYLLKTYWEEEFNPGFTVLADGKPQATLTTVETESPHSGVVLVTRFDGEFPVHQLYQVSYRLDDRGNYSMTEFYKVTEEELVD